MDFYKKNYNALYSKDPELASLLQDSADDREVYVGDGVCGGSFLAVQEGENLVALSSTYNGDHEAQRFAIAYEKQTDLQILVCFGVGSGEILRKLLQDKPDLIHVFLYEPSAAILAKAMESYDLTDLLTDPRIHIYVEGAHAENWVAALDEAMDYENFEYSAYVCLPKYRELYPEAEEEIYKNYKKIYTMRNVDQNTLIFYAHQGCVNEIRSMEWLLRSKNYRELCGKIPEDVPWIVVASGPALDSNVEELKEAVGKAIIFATDSAVPILEKHGIHPDLTCTVDPRKRETFSYIPDPEYKAPLVFAPDADYRMMEDYIGEDGFCFSAGNGYYQALFAEVEQEVPFFDGGGSVATCCVKLAYEAGARTIILLGQNLALENGKLHAGDNYGEIIWDQLEVEGYFGGKVVTTTDFKLYLDWYEMIIPQLTGCKVINSTEGGAKIPGAVHMPLKEAVQTYGTHAVNFREIYERIPRMFDTKERADHLLERLKSQRDYLAKTARHLEEIHGDYVKAGKRYKAGELSISEANRMNRQVDAVMREIAEGEASTMLYKRMIESELKLHKALREQGRHEQSDSLASLRIMTDYLREGHLAAEDLCAQWDIVLHKVAPEIYRS